MCACDKKVVVYTVNFGEYDNIQNVVKSTFCDYVCFTDNEQLNKGGWRYVYCNLDNANYLKESRRFKILPHRYFSDYDYSLYVDGNISVHADPFNLICQYLSLYKIALPSHYERNSIFEEAKYLIDTGKVDIDYAVLLKSQLLKYSKDGFCSQYKLTENNILFRRHNDCTVVKAMEEWWCEFISGVCRDQISLPYVLWKNNLIPVYIEESPRFSNRFFNINLHKMNLSLFNKIVLISINRRKRHFVYDIICRCFFAFKKYVL